MSVPVTPPAECWRIYQREHSAQPYGSITRTLSFTEGYSYQNLRRMILSYRDYKNSGWSPHLHTVDGVEEYRCPLPNGVAITIRRHYYIKGIITDSWWHLHWPTDIHPIDPALLINQVHQIDTLKEARALIAQYVENDYTIPEGACIL